MRPVVPLSLPVQLTRFFGREPESSVIEALLRQARLLTLTGAPGAGKTRLGAEVAGRLAPRFRDGVRFAELAPISEPAEVANAVAAAAGVDEEPGESIEATLGAALHEAELLLVLDNCEHIAEAAGRLALDLVSRCPQLTILATSRVALGVPGEQVWPLRPLPAGPAAELFTDRADLATGGYDVDPALGERICERLDGLPLAIELAAAWTRVLSPAQILERLDAALPLMRTLESTVDWSCGLLPEADQRLFERLSVFAGSFDLDAVEAVAGPADALSGLSALVDHSLVLVEPAPEMRYRLLEPLRQCGAARLAARDEAEAIRRGHAEHYLDVALCADAALRGSRRGLALRRLEEEEANLLAALDWARERRSDLGLRLCGALARFWELRGRVNDGAARLDEMLELDTPHRRVRATALARAARLAWRRRDYARARALLDESLVILRDLGDQPGVARRLRSLALVAVAEDEAAEAVDLCERSIAIFRAHDDEQGLAWAVMFLGWARYIEGDIAAGDERMREALAANRGSVAATVNALLGLAYGAVRAGDVPAHRARIVEALEILREAGGVVEEPDWLWAGAGLARAEGRTHAALRLAGAAEALGRRGGTHLNAQFIPPPDERTPPAIARRLRAEGARMSLSELMDEAIAEPEDDDPLSPREREVVELLADGLSNPEIAEELVISKRTVETHVDHIKQKLGHRSRQQVMAWALRFRSRESV